MTRTPTGTLTSARHSVPDAQPSRRVFRSGDCSCVRCVAEPGQRRPGSDGELAPKPVRRDHLSHQPQVDDRPRRQSLSQPRGRARPRGTGNPGSPRRDGAGRPGGVRRSGREGGDHRVGCLPRRLPFADGTRAVGTGAGVPGADARPGAEQHGRRLGAHRLQRDLRAGDDPAGASRIHQPEWIDPDGADQRRPRQKRRL